MARRLTRWASAMATAAAITAAACRNIFGASAPREGLVWLAIDSMTVLARVGGRGAGPAAAKHHLEAARSQRSGCRVRRADGRGHTGLAQRDDCNGPPSWRDRRRWLGGLAELASSSDSRSGCGNALPKRGRRGGSPVGRCHCTGKAAASAVSEWIYDAQFTLTDYHEKHTPASCAC